MNSITHHLPSVIPLVCPDETPRAHLSLLHDRELHAEEIRVRSEQRNGYARAMGRDETAYARALDAEIARRSELSLPLRRAEQLERERKLGIAEPASITAPTNAHVPIPIDRALYERWKSAELRAVGEYFWRIRRTHLDNTARHLPTTADVLNQEKLAQWKRARLQQVSGKTYKKEKSTVSNLCEWLASLGIGFVAPELPKLGKKDKGVRASTRKESYVPFADDEMESIIDALPRCSRSGKALWLAALIQWDQAQRPSTVRKLEVPKHWKRARLDVFDITADIDKERWARPLPLTARVRAAVEERVPQIGGRGLLVGPYQEALTDALKVAARKVGIDPERAEKITPYDIRHNAGRRIRRLAGASAAAYMLGHRKMSSTDIYTGAQESDGIAAIAALDLGGANGEKGANSPARTLC
jgi:hypothetical protein